MTAIRYFKISWFILALDYNFGACDTERHENVFFSDKVYFCV